MVSPLNCTRIFSGKRQSEIVKCIFSLESSGILLMLYTLAA